MFLMQYWGGPRTYSERRGHPRLRMRHAPFAIGDRSSGTPGCGTCGTAVDSLDLPPEHEQQLWDYLEMAAHSMQNQWDQQPRLSVRRPHAGGRAPADRVTDHTVAEETCAPLARQPRSRRARQAGTPWWRTAVFYQVYVRSFADADGDGVGDLAGIRDRLGYLQLLGVDALWLTPFYPSPMADHGYDVADPRDVDPLFGDLADVRRAGRRRARARPQGDDRPGAQPHLATGTRGSRRRWRRRRAARSATATSSGTARARTAPSRRTTGSRSSAARPGPGCPDGQWYLHLFAPEQPDLDWTNPEVRGGPRAHRCGSGWTAASTASASTWRTGMAKAAGPAGHRPRRTAERGAGLDGSGEQDPRFDVDGVHDVHRHDPPGPRLVPGPDGGRRGLGAPTTSGWPATSGPTSCTWRFNFRLLQATWDAAAFRDGDRRLARRDGLGRRADHLGAVQPRRGPARHPVRRTATRRPAGAGPGPPRWCSSRCPASPTSTTATSSACPNVELPDEALQDPVWERSGHTERGRDGERVPMPWGGEKPPYGFSTGGDDLAADAGRLGRPDRRGAAGGPGLDAVALPPGAGAAARPPRRSAGRARVVRPRPASCLAFRRPGGLLCALNASAEPVPMPPGEVLLASGPLGADGTAAARHGGLARLSPPAPLSVG